MCLLIKIEAEVLVSRVYYLSSLLVVEFFYITTTTVLANPKITYL